jgi:hypothetical protein
VAAMFVSEELRPKMDERWRHGTIPVTCPTQARIGTMFRRSIAIILLFLVGSSGLLAVAQGAKTPLTASEVMSRIIVATGASPPTDTVDTLKAGDPNTVVTGIVTTFMDTYPVLEQAVADGKNLIITHEPTFYNHRDDASILAGDAVQAQKLEYIRQHHLVVWPATQSMGDGNLLLPINRTTPDDRCSYLIPED